MNKEDLEFFEIYCTALRCVKCNKLSKSFGFCYEHFDKKYILIFLKSIRHGVYFLGLLTDGVVYNKTNFHQIDQNELQKRHMQYKILCFETIEAIEKKQIPFSDKLQRQLESASEIQNLDYFTTEFGSITNTTINYSHIINKLTSNNLYFLNKPIKFKSIGDHYKNLSNIISHINLLKSNEYQLRQIMKFQNPTYTKATNSLFVQQFINAIQNAKIDDKFKKHIMFVKEEHCVKINNKKLRFDIYLILKSNNGSNHKIFIEIDEDYQFTSSHDRTNDILKDLYCIQNGYSLCRYYCKSQCVSCDDTKFIRNYLETIIMKNQQQFYFSQKYIDSKNKPQKKKTSIIITDKEYKELKKSVIL